MKNDAIKVKRIGDDPHSFMVTEDIIGCVKPGKHYKATLKGLDETERISVRVNFSRTAGVAPN